MSTVDQVVLEDGKYTLTHENGKLTALRNGEPWQDFSGNKFVYLLLMEIVNQRRVIQEVNSWIVCAAIAPPDDMMENAPRIIEITEPGFRYAD